MLLGGFFPWSHLGLEKPHTHTREPPRHRQQELIPRICLRRVKLIPAESAGQRGRGAGAQGGHGAPRARREASQLQDSSQVTVCLRDDSGGISGI